MNDFQKSIKKYGVYFEELRQRLVTLTKLFVLVFAVGFFTTSPAIRFMMKNLNIDGVTIVTTSPFQLIELAMSVGFFVACIITVPIFIYHLYSFLKSGLLPKERNLFILSLPVGFGLFLLGFFYGIGILYYGIKLIAKVNIGLGISNYWNISSFISQIVLTSSLLGLIFLFPIVINFLIRLNILNINFLRKKRKHAVVVIFLIVSLLPPTDGLSLILMAAPLLLIFELTVLFNRRKYNGRHLTT